MAHAVDEVDLHTASPKRQQDIIKDFVDSRNMISTFRQNMPELENIARNQLNDKEHYGRLKTLNFDLAIVSLFPISRSLLVLPYNLGIPYIGVTTLFEPWLTRNPSLPSFAPSNIVAGQFTPVMNFWQRLYNLWITIEWNVCPRVAYLEDNFIQQYIRDKPLVTMNQLVTQCMLVLLDVDPILDYPKPLMPHEITIGGLTTKPAKPLPQEIDEFINSAEDGVILMTFGSSSYNLDSNLVNEFVKAFAMIRQKIIWKYSKQLDNLPSNIKVMSWLPQNDILGHPKIKLFITHCGNNGQMEALYHGVPMIGFPMWTDQLYNCPRLNYHGYGICLDTTTFKGEHLVSAVNNILENASCAENIRKASKIFRGNPMTPQQRALYWIEHVMKNGGKHLHSHALDMPWYQYLMLDIACFVLGMAGISFLLCTILAYMFCKKCTRLSFISHVKED